MASPPLLFILHWSLPSDSCNSPKWSLRKWARVPPVGAIASTAAFCKHGGAMMKDLPCQPPIKAQKRLACADDHQLPFVYQANFAEHHVSLR